MKNFICKKAGLIIFLAASFAACRKSEIISGFQASPKLLLSVVPGINNDGLLSVVNDSAHCRFAYAPLDVEETTVLLKVQVVGEQSGQDRSFKIEIDPAQSTALPVEYSLPGQYVLPAGESFINVPLVLKRSDRIAQTETYITVRLAPTADFQVETDKQQVNGERTRFRIYWSDLLTRPAWWATTYFGMIGKYSRIKHRFMLDVLAMTPIEFEKFNSDFFMFLETNTVENIWKNHLTIYNRNNPGNPLKNEFGEEIGFCAACN